MKKLGKLSINLNKVIKNEELVNLRGGLGYSYEIVASECQSPRKVYSCTCNDAVVSWYGCYKDDTDVNKALGKYCYQNGGNCYTN